MRISENLMSFGLGYLSYKPSNSCCRQFVYYYVLNPFSKFCLRYTNEKQNTLILIILNFNVTYPFQRITVYLQVSYKNKLYYMKQWSFNVFKGNRWYLLTFYKVFFSFNSFINTTFYIPTKKRVLSNTCFLCFFSSHINETWIKWTHDFKVKVSLI